MILFAATLFHNCFCFLDINSIQIQSNRNSRWCHFGVTNRTSALNWFQRVIIHWLYTLIHIILTAMKQVKPVEINWTTTICLLSINLNTMDSHYSSIICICKERPHKPRTDCASRRPQFAACVPNCDPSLKNVAGILILKEPNHASFNQKTPLQWKEVTRNANQAYRININHRCPTDRSNNNDGVVGKKTRLTSHTFIIMIPTLTPHTAHNARRRSAAKPFTHAYMPIKPCKRVVRVPSI